MNIDKVMNKFLALVVLVLVSTSAFSGEYFTEGDCDGYPRVKVESLEGTCIGLVYQDMDKQVMRKPRLLTEIDDSGSFLITDMGGWSDNRGKLLLLSHSKSGVSVDTLLSKLNLPHGLSNGPDNSFLIGEKHQIIQIKK